MIWTKGLNRTTKHNWLDQSYWEDRQAYASCNVKLLAFGAKVHNSSFSLVIFSTLGSFLGRFWAFLRQFGTLLDQIVALLEQFWAIGLVWSGLVLDQHWGVQSSFEQSNLNVGIGWDWMDGISLTSLTTRSPYGDNKIKKRVADEDVIW